LNPQKILVKANHQNLERIFLQGGLVMGFPNKDEMEGKFDKAKGAVKENVGRAINDRDMETEGQADRAEGNVEEGFGKARRKIGETIEDIGDSIKR
jgi:uncharacterized protein YjbJ (UPF0337 family)